MFSKQKYESDIKLGEKYRDEQTGITGTATSIYFFQHGCERVNLELVVNGEIKDYTFDSPRLTHVESGRQATTTRTGGPGTSATGQAPGARPVPGRR